MKYGSRFGSSFKEAMESKEYWLEDVQFSFIESLLEAMDEKEISRKELAERLGKSQAYVSKTLNANALNFTLKTMINFSWALGYRLSLCLEELESTTIKIWENLIDASDMAPVSWRSADPQKAVPSDNESSERAEESNGHPVDAIAA
jgi:transcriptional regulator with XRE-family HTH domain